MRDLGLVFRRGALVAQQRDCFIAASLKGCVKASLWWAIVGGYHLSSKIRYTHGHGVVFHSGALGLLKPEPPGGVAVMLSVVGFYPAFLCLRVSASREIS